MAHPGFATDAIWILNTDEAELPKTRTVNNFEVYLSDIFKQYLRLFSELQTLDYVTQQIVSSRRLVRQLSTRILEAIHEYYRGFPHIAFHKLQLAINAVSLHLNRLYTPLNVAGTATLDQLYRIRAVRPDETQLLIDQIFTTCHLKSVI